jgi:hypothetical protein
MSSDLYRISADEVIERMRPTTLIDFIVMLDNLHAIDELDSVEATLLAAAAEALIAIVGTSEAIGMMADADIDAENPIIERILSEQAEPTPEPATWQIWRDRTSGERWAAEIENGIAVGGYGPLTPEEDAQLKANPWAWECDADSETAGWLNENADEFRVVWPYISG